MSNCDYPQGGNKAWAESITPIPGLAVREIGVHKTIATQHTHSKPTNRRGLLLRLHPLVDAFTSFHKSKRRILVSERQRNFSIRAAVRLQIEMRMGPYRDASRLLA